ncbi:MAG: hypothetical protein ACO1NX_05310 [Chitinophagaceae bacterium]
MKWILIPLLMALAACTKSIAVEDDRLGNGFHHGKVGAAARQLLSDEQFRSLVVEVQYMSGFKPDSTALENLKTFLFEHLHKPAGITIVTSEIAPVADSVLTLEQIAAIENAHRTVYSAGKQLAVYILYTNGYYTNDKMLGYAYKNTSAVMFGKNLQDLAADSKKQNPTALETRVLQHEMAHLMGLVNVGTPMKKAHKDEKNGKHCTNKACLMYHLADTDELPGLLVKKQVPRLDEACLEDLRANGGK